MNTDIQGKGAWVSKEAAQQVSAWGKRRGTSNDDRKLPVLAKSCLRAGLREAAQQLEQRADRVRETFGSRPEYEEIVRTWDIAAADLRALAGKELS